MTYPAPGHEPEIPDSAATSTPRRLGFRFPAEWEPHAATWLVWPHEREDWPDRFGPIPWVYAEIVRHLVRSEPVKILVLSGKHRRRAQRALERVGVKPDRDAVEFLKVPTDRVWLRDSGPMFVVRETDRRVALTDWKFNAWAKYPNHLRDDRVPRRLAKRLGMERWVPRVGREGDDPTRRRRRVVLEGGAVDFNGRGIVLTTEECLLSPIQERNPGLSRDALERCFSEYLAVDRVIWLDRGIAGDDTHGHVDDITRFVAPDRVVTAVEHDATDINHEPLAENLRRLRAATDQDGRPLEVVELPMPRPLIFEGQRLPASYANFYIANRVVLVPTFNDPADRRALSILAEQFPDREVVGIHAVDLVWGLGTLHCLTREQPAGPPA